MKDWKKVLIAREATIHEAIRAIDQGALQITMVVDQERHLLGTVTDGDLRRGILSGISLDSPVDRIMNTQPTVVRTGAGRHEVLSVMQAKKLHQVPVVDERGRLVGLEIIEDMLQPQKRSNWVVIMAGGLGMRLRPMTETCPKPMLKVGGRPVLETLLENLVKQGFHRFFFAVNYMAEMIESHFADGSRFGAEIQYLREEERLGTAGALSLLPETPAEPILVTNGDLLTKVNFQHLFDFHHEHGGFGTMCVREYDFQVPYGVVVVDKHRLLSIEEKPIQKFFVNAGIYVLSPQALSLIPPNQNLDMPLVFQKMVRMGHETAVFPIREYWLDIGRYDEFEQANNDYLEFFR